MDIPGSAILASLRLLIPTVLHAWLSLELHLFCIRTAIANGAIGALDCANDTQ